MRPKEILMQEAESTTTTSAGNSPPPAAESAAAESAAPAVTPGNGDIASGGEPLVEGGEDWGALSRDDDGEAAQPAKPAAETPPAVTPKVETPPPAVAAPKPGETPPATSLAVPPKVETPPATSSAETTPPPAPAEAPEAKAAREKAEREASEKKLHEDLVEFYKIPDDMAAQLATEPELVLPQLASRVHQAILANVRQLLDQSVPHVVSGMLKVQQRDQEARAQFYGRWPNLKQHEALVMKAAGMFSQLNPSATPEQRIEAIGKIVSESLGLPVAPPPPGAKPSGSTPPPAPAHRPAGTTASGGGQPPAPDNEFVQIAEEFVNSGE